MGPVRDTDCVASLSSRAASVALLAGLAVAGADPVAGGAQAAVLLAAGVGVDDEVLVLAGWLVGGAALGGGLGYVAVAAGGVPLSAGVGAGLGIALGGGLGVVANLVATGAEPADRTETVDLEVGGEDDDAPSPRPADLFDDHPDPVLYVSDEGQGPVVRAANEAFAETFDVGADVLTGAPVEEALMVTDRATDVREALDGERSLDVVVDCETAAGDRQFRLRIAGDDDAYLLYTPVEW